MQPKRKVDEQSETRESTSESQSKRARSCASSEDFEPTNTEAAASFSFNVQRPMRKEVPIVDSIYGQRGAIPGLDDADDDESEESEYAEGVDGYSLSTRDAMAYLRVVRSEARGIPNLLFAPPESAVDGTPDPFIYDARHDDSRGYYVDGAYIAAPVLGPNLPSTISDSAIHSDLNAEEGSWSAEASSKDAYTSSLLGIFKKQRAELHSIPSSKAAQKLPPNTSIFLPKYTPDAYKQFQGMIRSRDPTPPHLAALSKPTVLRMLDLSTQLLKRRKNVDGRYSAWVWGLLCRIGDAGTLDSDAVSVLRELGKKAVWVGIGFMDSDAAISTEQYADDSEYHVKDEDGLECDSGQTAFEDAYALNAGDVNSNSCKEGRLANYTRQTRRRNTSSPDPPDFDTASVYKRRRNTSSPVSPDEQSQGIPSDIQSDMMKPPPESVEEVAAAKAKLLQRLNSPPLPKTRVTGRPKIDDRHNDSEGQCPNSNTCATIDMIVTIVGELYGQRDLLEFRDSWGGDTGLWG